MIFRISHYQIHHRKRPKPDRILLLRKTIIQDNEVRLIDLLIAAIKMKDISDVAHERTCTKTTTPYPISERLTQRI